MSLKSPNSTVELLGLIAVVFGIIGGLFGAGKWVYDMTSLLATKDYHEETMNEAIEQRIDPIQTSVQQVEAAVAVPRMQNILDLKCATDGDIPMEVENILQRTKQRYKEIEGRDFDDGHCHEGKRISTYEARKLGLIP